MSGLRNRRRGSPSSSYESKLSNTKKKRSRRGFDLGTIVLVRINDEGWIEARITRRSGDGTYDVQSLKEGRLLSSVSPTCVRLPPKMDVSSKRREMLAPLWWEHWGTLTGASIWTTCVHVVLYAITFHFQVPSSLSNVLTWYSILSVILYVICSYSKGLPFDAARKITAIGSLAAWALSAFVVLCGIRTLLFEIWQRGLGHLFYLPFAPFENMTYNNVASVCLFCASQSAVTWAHAVFGVLTTGYRPNMYARPARVFRILFHPKNMGIYALYILSAVFAFHVFPYRPEMETTIYRDSVLAGFVKYASSTRQEAFVIRFPRLERGRILQVWERLPLVFQNSCVDTLTTFVLILILDWMYYSDTTTMWHLRSLLLLFSSWHVAQHVLEIFLTTPMRRMTLEHAVAAIAVPSRDSVVSSFLRYEERLEDETSAEMSGVDGTAVSSRNGTPYASFSPLRRSNTSEPEWRHLYRAHAKRYEDVAYETLRRALRKSQETILRPSLVCTFTGHGSEATSLERAMLRRHALRKLHERTRLDPLARAALIGANDGKLWSDALQRLTSLVDAMTLSVQMCTRTFSQHKALARVVGNVMDREAAERVHVAYGLGRRETIQAAQRRKLLQRTRCPDFVSPFVEDLSPAKLYLDGLPEMRASVNCFRRDARTVCQSVFSDSQSVDWAAQTLAQIVTAAYNEDTEGRVKNSVPIVLSCLLGCLLALEDFVRSPMFLARNSHVDAPVLASELKLEGHQLLRPQPDVLALSMVRAICMICRTYHKYLHLFALAPEHNTRLQSLLEGMGLIDDNIAD